MGRVFVGQHPMNGLVASRAGNRLSDGLGGRGPAWGNAWLTELCNGSKACQVVAKFG